MSYSLNIKNFQGIRDLTFEVSGFTVLKGHSSAGKSSVRRALDFLLRNNWDKNFLRKGETLCEVSLESPGLRIDRRKSKKENSYSVTVNGKTTNYDKIGTDVPDQFSVLGLTPLKAEDVETDLNLYRQRDRMFLVQYSAAERTKVLNTLFKVGKFETAARLVKKDLYNLRTDVNALGGSIEADKELIRKYGEILPMMEALRESCWWFQEGVPQYLDLMSKKRGLESDLESLDTRVKFLDLLHKDLEISYDLTQILTYFEVKNNKEALVASIEKALSNFRSLQDLLESLSLLGEYQSLGSRNSSLAQRVELLDRALGEYDKIGMRVTALGDLEQYSAFQAKADESQKIVDILKDFDDSCKLWLIASVYMECGDKVKYLQGCLENLESQLIEERKNVCPTCGRPWEVLSEHQHV